MRSSDTSNKDSHTLSHGSLAKLDALNEKLGWGERETIQYKVLEKDEKYRAERDEHKSHRVDKRESQRPRREHRDHNHYREREKQRTVSGQVLEKGGYFEFEHRGRQRGGGYSLEEEERKRRKKRWKWTCQY